MYFHTAADKPADDKKVIEDAGEDVADAKTAPNPNGFFADFLDSVGDHLFAILGFDLQFYVLFLVLGCMFCCSCRQGQATGWERAL